MTTMESCFVTKIHNNNCLDGKNVIDDVGGTVIDLERLQFPF